MHFILILLISSASCGVLPSYKNEGISKAYYRHKRNIDVQSSGDKYDIHVKKDLLNDKKLSLYGDIEGLTSNNYDSIKTGLDFKDSRGDSLGISALQSKDARKLSGQGELNLFNTDTQSLDAKAFGEKDFLNNGHFKYGGSLDYNNKKGHDLFIKALEDSDLGKDFSVKGKYTIFDKPNYNLDAQGFWHKNIPKGGSSIESYGAGLNYLNKNGDIASLFAQHKPDLGNEVTAAGKFNAFHNDNHNLDFSGKLSRVFPNDPKIGAYNSYSANMDYLFKDKIGANVGIDHSGLSQRTDFSALGKLNILKKDNSYLDLFGGLTRSISPNFDSGYNPNFGIKFGTSF